MSSDALTVSGLSLSINARGGGGGARVVDGVSFAVAKGGALGIVGESGSGKSLTLRAIMALLPAAVQLDAGTVSLAGQPLALAGRAARRQRRGRLAMVFQDALSALDPVHTVGSQVAEVGRCVRGLSRARAWENTIELLDLVGIRDPRRRAHAYPHELSGGMRQRVMLAIALATEPDVLLCDEPTTALDVTVQAQVLELLDDLRRRLQLALVFVSHDLAVVRELCEELAVMYAGRIVETGPTASLLARPLHPYTLGLLQATVDVDERERLPQPIPGNIPDPGRLPAGCSFHPRCRLATEECARTDVKLVVIGDSEGSRGRGRGGGERASACIHWDRVSEP
jgi:oligopeptide/dipeptide ABC transporter ATP-binding protein